VHVLIKQPNKENADKPPINKGSVFPLGFKRAWGILEDNSWEKVASNYIQIRIF